MAHLLEELDRRHRVVPEDGVDGAHDADGPAPNSGSQLLVRPVCSSVGQAGTRVSRLHEKQSEWPSR